MVLKRYIVFTIGDDHFFQSLLQKCVKTGCPKWKEEKSVADIVIHEYFDHGVLYACSRCQVVLPYTILQYHKETSCDDWKAAKLYLDNSREEKGRRTPIPANKRPDVLTVKNKDGTKRQHAMSTPGIEIEFNMNGNSGDDEESEDS